MSADPVIVFEWNGEALVPLSRFHNVANDKFTVGERYRCEVVEEASMRSRAHYFATLHDLWMSLPDAIATDFPTVDHLRKRALIACGFRDERRLVTSSPAEARKVAAWLKPRDEYALVSVNGEVVIEWTAKSQSIKAMGKAQFGESKQRVLEFVAEMVGVDPATISTSARAA